MARLALVLCWIPRVRRGSSTSSSVGETSSALNDLNLLLTLATLVPLGLVKKAFATAAANASGRFPATFAAAANGRQRNPDGFTTAANGFW